MEFGVMSLWGYDTLSIIPEMLVLGLFMLPALYFFCYLPLRLILNFLSSLFERFTWESSAVFEASEYALQQISLAKREIHDFRIV